MMNMTNKHWQRKTTGFSILAGFALGLLGGCAPTDSAGLGASAIGFIRDFLLNAAAAFLL